MAARHGLAIGLLLPLSAQVQLPAEGDKAAQMTLDERLARRFDPVVQSQARAAAGIPEEVASSPRDFVDGSRNPELLLPFEVFRHLIAVTFSRNAETRRFYRQQLRPGARRAGLPDNMWEVLSVVAADYLKTLEQEQNLAAALPESSQEDRGRLLARIAEAQAPQCALRAKALAAARQAFGASAFDRFLYEAVAPHVIILSDDAPATPEQLRYVEGGCQ
jgi:hypothetical protein